MVYAELIGVIALISCVVFFIMNFLADVRRRQALRANAMEKAQAALATDNYIKIDEVLAFWSQSLTEEMRAYMSRRRDELYLEKNT